MKEPDINKKIELYLEGKLQGNELHHFENLLKNNKRITKLFIDYKHAVESEIQKHAQSCLLKLNSKRAENII